VTFLALAADFIFRSRLRNSGKRAKPDFSLAMVRLCPRLLQSRFFAALSTSLPNVC